MSATQPGGKFHGPASPDAPEPRGMGYGGAREDGTGANTRDRIRGAAMSEQEFKPGGICGEWTLKRFVAAGGMGEVWEVESTLAGKRAALKRIRPELSTKPKHVKAFLTEAKILGILECPFIVQLLSGGWYAGSPYLVMEWLEGVTLRDFMNQRQEPVELAHALHYAVSAATALCAAHAVDILHRDLKPENIFMLEKRKLKVVDFGLAKLAAKNRTARTSGLGDMCTVHYAAPEQLQGGDVDDRTDVRALALIFFEMVTLRWAFADQPHVLPARDIARANQLLAEPPSLAKVVRGCPKPLVALIDAALSRDQNKRPHSTEFLAGLRDVATGLTGKRVHDLRPAPAGRKEQDESSVQVRVLPQIRTASLPPDRPPADPTAAGNPPPPSPPLTSVVRTVRMAPRPADAELEAARRASALRDARGGETTPDKAGDATNPGRIAELPPEPNPSPPTSRTSVSVTQAPSAAPPPGPGPMSPSKPTAPQRHDTSAASAAERASVELAERPTLPWKRRAPAREGSSSLSPTHQGTAVDTARVRKIPLWTAPLLGAVLVLGGFEALRFLRGQPHRHDQGDQLRSTASASVAPTAMPATPAASAEPSVTVMPTTPSATAEPAATEPPVSPTPAATASTTAMPSTTTPPLPALTESPTARPATELTASAAPVASAGTATPAAQATQRAQVGGVTASPTPPADELFLRKRAAAPKPGKPTGSSTTQPPATPVQASPPPSPAKHRVFGSEE